MNKRRYKNNLIPAGSIIHRATAAVLRKRGFAEGEVITRWQDIVGPKLAAISAPEKLLQRRGDLAGAILYVRVDKAAALELQHISPTVIERINKFYGYRAVDRLKLVQGPLPVRVTKPESRQRPLTNSESTLLSKRVSGTKNNNLRQALKRLGSSVLSLRTISDHKN